MRVMKFLRSVLLSGLDVNKGEFYDFRRYIGTYVSMKWWGEFKGAGGYYNIRLDYLIISEGTV